MQFIFKVILNLSIAFFFSTITCYSQVFFVSNLSEFNTAVDEVQPGGKIVLADGIWENITLEFTTNGTEEDSITLTSETPGKVVLTGTSKLEIAGEYLIVENLDFNGGRSTGDAIISFRINASNEANHSRVTNCRIINYNPDSDVTDYKWVSLYGKNNRVDHCHFEGKNNEGALMVVWLSGTANFHRIDHNYFTNIPELGRNGGETIRIGTSDNSLTESRTTVEYNLFESCDGEIEIISNKSGFNVYRYNTFRDNEGTLTLRHGNDCEVYGNFFFGGNKDSGGVRIIGERHKVYNNYFEGLNGDGFRAALSITNGVPDSPLNRYFQVKAAQVVNNTFIACKEPIAIGEGKSEELSLPPLNCTIANNVIDHTTGSKAITYTDIPINIEYLTNYVNGTVGIADDGIINEDPLVEENENFYRPSSTSPLINASTGSFDFIAKDIEGQSRIDTPDVGCDEVSSSKVLNKPLFKEDVGFDWTVDNSITSIDALVQSKIIVSGKNGKVIIRGVNEDQFPVRLMLINTNGQRIFDNTIITDTVNVGNFKGVFIAILLDRSNQIVAKSKISLSYN